MNHVAATVGVAEMECLPWVLARYQENGLYYDEELAGVRGVTVLKRPPNSRSAYWVYTFLAEERDRLLKRFRERGVFASKVHLRNDIYSCFGGKGEALPGVDEFSAHCLSIPCGWWVGPEDRSRIVDIASEGMF
jgi:dTDP-4-amino-4,6-dideoxygalactose transaminase